MCCVEGHRVFGVDMYVLELSESHWSWLGDPERIRIRADFGGSVADFPLTLNTRQGRKGKKIS